MTYLRASTQLNGHSPQTLPNAAAARSLARLSARSAASTVLNGSTFPAFRRRSRPMPFSRHQSAPFRARFSVRYANFADSSARVIESGNAAPSYYEHRNWGDSTGGYLAVTIAQSLDSKRIESESGLYSFAAHHRDGGRLANASPLSGSPAPHYRGRP